MAKVMVRAPELTTQDKSELVLEYLKEEAICRIQLDVDLRCALFYVT
jgi:hypothetical protein